MTDTRICPRCSRTVPWTAEEWNGAQECCARCAAEASESALPHRGGIAVRVTGIDIPFGDVLAFVFKLTFASILVGLILGLAYLVLQAIRSDY